MHKNVLESFITVYIIIDGLQYYLNITSPAFILYGLLVMKTNSMEQSP